MNRHIVNKVDDFYIVNFTTKENFEFRLKLWDYFHKYNTHLLKNVISEFYKDIFCDKEKVDVLWNNFKERTLLRIEFSLCMLNATSHTKNLDMTYSYNKDNNKLDIELSASHYLDNSIIDKLNDDKYLTSSIQKDLLEMYRYDGEFCFSNGLPF